MDLTFLNYVGKSIVAFLILFFLCLNIEAQDPRVVDSLKKIYQQDLLVGVEKLELLKNLSFNEINNRELSLKYAEELISLSKAENNYQYLSSGYLQKGNTNRVTGDLNLALDAFFKSVEAATKAGYVPGQGSAYMAIADTYSEMGNSNNAEIYYNNAIQLLRKTDDSISLAIALLNSGDEYFHNRKYDSALQYFEESGRIFKNANYSIGMAYNLGNIGMVYAEQGKDILAESNISEAIEILEEVEDFYAISDYLTYMSDIYLRQNDFSNALKYAERSLNLAQIHGLKKQISESNLHLSELHEQIGNEAASFKYYRDHIAYRDSITNLESVQQMADLRTDFEVSQKQIEVDLLNQQKRNQQITVVAVIIASSLIGLLALIIFRRYKYTQKINKIIEEEKNRSDHLLLNILPEETAKELKEFGKVKAHKFESISVLFTDFIGFTHYAENLSPEELVESVNFYYSKFDDIIDKHGIEKIKTIGDSYMCACGLHFHSHDHAFIIVSAALEIAEFVKECKKINHKNEPRFDIRIGINSGPVVAGVVGNKKFAYDIWGDAVNIASGMESTSEPGKINISEYTYQLIKDKFDCVYRGKLEVKNKGLMKMYFVNNVMDEAFKKPMTDLKESIIN